MDELKISKFTFNCLLISANCKDRLPPSMYHFCENTVRQKRKLLTRHKENFDFFAVYKDPCLFNTQDLLGKGFAYRVYTFLKFF